jgi:predicted branched-subunit amino acid permease
VWVILATAFCVNLRFAVFSLHLRPYMMHLPLWRRLMGGYLIADLSYVMFVQRYPDPVENTPELIANNAHGTCGNPLISSQLIDVERAKQQAYLLGNCIINWASWVFPCVAGVLLGKLIPEAWGLGFAGILALVGIACSLATSQLRIISALIAGAAGVVAFALPLRLNILVAIGVAVVICLSLERFGPANQAA